MSMNKPSPLQFGALQRTSASIALLAVLCSGTAVMAQESSVTLTLWHNTGDSSALLSLYEAYEAASGNTIELVDIPADTYPTSVQVKWATGDRPDIMEYNGTVQDMRQLNMSENMIDLSDMAFVEASGAVAAISGTLDGQTFGAVLGPISSFGAFYNRDVFAAAGVDVPTNYAQLLDVCEALKATGVPPIHVGAGSEFPALMIAGFSYMADYSAGGLYGQSVAAGEIKVNDPDGPIVAALTAIDVLREAGCINEDAVTATFQDSIKAIYEGEAALSFLPSNFIAQFYDLGAGDNAAVDAKVGLTAISAEMGIPSYSASALGTFFYQKPVMKHVKQRLMALSNG